MNLVSKIIKSANQYNAETVSAEVPANYALLERLLKQHRQLNQQQKIIEKSNVKDNAGAIATLKLVNQFKKNFEAHVLLEQRELYKHLEQVCTDEKLDVVTKFRVELNGVVNQVLRFCNRYNSAQKIRQGEDSFNKDGKEIRKLVRNGSRREERELFPIYEKLV